MWWERAPEVAAVLAELLDSGVSDGGGAAPLPHQVRVQVGLYRAGILLCSLSVEALQPQVQLRGGHHIRNRPLHKK